MQHSQRLSHMFMLKQIWRYDKKLFLIALLKIPSDVINSLINIYLTSAIVGAVIEGNLYRLLLMLCVFSILKFGVSVLSQWSENQFSNRSYDLKMDFVSDYAAKYMKMNYADIESVEGKDLAQRAKNSMFHFDYRAKPMVEAYLLNVSALFGQMFGLLSYGGIISILNPVILIVLVVTAGFTFVFQKYMVAYDRKDRLRYIPIERKLYYLIREAKNFKAAKDIKLYGMSNWFTKLFEEQMDKQINLYQRRSKIFVLINLILIVVNLVFNGFIYFYLIDMYTSSVIEIQSFIFYFGLITGFNSWLLGFISKIEDMQRVGFQIDDLRKFLSDGEEQGKSERMNPETSIEFKDVSYQYENGKKEVLKHVSFSVKEGEKIAVVGTNGAGKTTLIKLLCGLYSPTSGRIMIGGEDIATINSKKLFRRFSVVFQDIYVLPTSIARNIALQKEIDAVKLDKALIMSGLKSKIEKLPKKSDTVLLKSIQDEAIELSGGELQKLALARALYKNGDIMILDEPTAALDPIAESEMYNKYNELSQNTTSIFISHRLASTRFCDRIFFMDNGEIVESGTHEELMELNGRYAKMYKIQSQYYQETYQEVIT